MFARMLLARHGHERMLTGPIPWNKPGTALSDRASVHEPVAEARVPPPQVSLRQLEVSFELLSSRDGMLLLS